MKKKVIITKASGETEEFSSEKLRQSLINAGADRHLAAGIEREVRSTLVRGMPTRKIYGHAFRLLRKHSRHVAGRYHLKHALMELGPSGFPFEEYIGALLKHQGYEVRLNEIVKGKCVSHEIDVIAEKDHIRFMIECKYHNQSGIASDVKIPLYVRSRFLDVEAGWKQYDGHDMKFHEGWLVTNTRFTKDAIQYGTCSGLKLLGWNYPLKDSLKDMIDRMGLHPLTCLTSLTKYEKEQLLKKHIVLARAIPENENILRSLRLSPERIRTVREEAERLGGNGNVK